MDKEKCSTYIMSRVTGYWSPTFTWNEGKKAEKEDRKVYDNSVKEINNGKVV
jgi:anaerobic ribonucleoside-triphosphate reductase